MLQAPSPTSSLAPGAWHLEPDLTPGACRSGAVFLDRDGVINYNREDYVKSPEEFVFLPRSAAAAARLTRAGWALFVISNQAGVGKGLLTDEALAAITRKMLDGLAAAGACVQGVYYCPHLPDGGCDCRKPAPGLLRRAAREHGLDLARTFFVGDDRRDVAAGAAAGVRTLLVLSGKTSRAEADALAGETGTAFEPAYVAADLSAAADWILENGP
jgi:D-glycero-D-manno-heptose 1,7-bisphosphate phosphatase